MHSARRHAQAKARNTFRILRAPRSALLLFTTVVWAALAWVSPARAIPTVLDGYVLRQVGTGLTGANDIFRDAQGRLLVAELGQSGNPGPQDGVVSELMPDGTRNVISSGFFDPVGIVVDQTGNLFVADFGPTTVTGDLDGLIWKDDGTGPVVLATGGFSTPHDLLLDPSVPGTLLVPDLGTFVSAACPGDSTIFRVDTVTGATSTFFDDGCGGLRNIRAIAADSTGRIHVADNETSPPNVFTIDSPTSASAVVTSPPFVTPQKICFDQQGDLFVPDASTNTIYRIRAGTDTAQPFITNVPSVTGLFIDGNDFYFTESRTTVWVASPATVPAVSTWGLLAMLLLVYAAGAVGIRRAAALSLRARLS